MKDKVLALLKEQDEYVSGEEISSKLGITRAGVWKNINKLKEEGYAIESVTRKGYRLVNTPDILTKSELLSIVDTKVLGREIYYYDQVESTNDTAKELARKGEQEGTVVIADRQLSGKGRLGKGWDSPSGTGIWMSIILRPDMLPAFASQLTLLAGLGMCEAISKVTGLEAKIKWPNDIVVQGKKVCGILTEMSAEIERVKYIVVGIGVNVNTKDFPDELAHATSLSLQGGRNFVRRVIVKEFIQLFETDYLCYKQEKNLVLFLERYRRQCITLNRQVKILAPEGEYLAYAKDIKADGALVVVNEQGSEYAISSGEVSVRGIYDYV